MIRSLGRIIWVVIAFVLAVIAGIVVLGFVGLERLTAATTGGTEVASTLEQWLSLADGFVGLTQWGAALSIVPAILTVVVGELGRIRSLVYWVAAGGVAAVAVPLVQGMADTSEVLLPAAQLLQILATAGFAAGVVYWALAGRTS